MDFAPFARIMLRYGIGYLLGSATGDALAADADIVTLVALGMGAFVEFAYGLAKKKGWAT